MDLSTTLPNAEVAFISDEKLYDYLLNPHHEVGCNKARVFRSAFGVEQENWRDFRDTLLEAVRSDSSNSKGPMRGHGCVLYRVGVVLAGQDGSDKQVVTIWKVEDDDDEGIPRLVTAYLDI